MNEILETEGYELAKARLGHLSNESEALEKSLSALQPLQSEHVVK